LEIRNLDGKNGKNKFLFLILMQDYKHFSVKTKLFLHLQPEENQQISLNEEEASNSIIQ
jgi:hypothetical protein